MLWVLTNVLIVSRRMVSRKSAVSPSPTVGAAVRKYRQPEATNATADPNKVQRVVSRQPTVGR